LIQNWYSGVSADSPLAHVAEAVRVIGVPGADGDPGFGIRLGTVHSVIWG
jgi:hypothetical protein